MSRRLYPSTHLLSVWNRPQSIARTSTNEASFRNSEIDFVPDASNRLENLDTSDSGIVGGWVGMDLLGSERMNDYCGKHRVLRSKGIRTPDKGLHAANESRCPIPLTDSTLWRFDTMYGWRRGLEDAYATRMEYRWKYRA